MQDDFPEQPYQTTVGHVLMQHLQGVVTFWFNWITTFTTSTGAFLYDEIGHKLWFEKRKKEKRKLQNGHPYKGYKIFWLKEVVPVMDQCQNTVCKKRKKKKKKKINYQLVLLDLLQFQCCYCTSGNLHVSTIFKHIFLSF